MTMSKFLQRLLRDEQATTAVEYCVMLSMILLAVILGIYAAGGGVSSWWNTINSDLNTHGF